MSRMVSFVAIMAKHNFKTDFPLFSFRFVLRSQRKKSM